MTSLRSTFAAAALLGIGALCSPSPAEARGHHRVTADPPDPATFGPYDVGVMEVSFRAHHRAAPLTALVWYPADAAPNTFPYLYGETDAGAPFSASAVKGLPVAGDRQLFPAIAYSHGAGGYAYQGVWLTEHLASHGYVVIGVTHPNNNVDDFNEISMVMGAFTRPLDAQAMLDELEDLNTQAGSALRGRIDTGLMGMTGFSFGGYTTLMIGGARFNFNLPNQRCAAGDPFSCRLVDEAESWNLEDGFLDMSDPRVTVIAPMAPWTLGLFRDEGLAFVQIPLQVQGGGEDPTCTMELNIEPVWENASGPRSILEIFDANHTTFSANCAALDASDPDCLAPFIDPDLSHRISATYITSHFKVFLDGDSRYLPWLAPDSAAGMEELVEWREDLGVF